MTTEGERLDPKILDRSSKQRVAETAGVTVGDIDRLLTRFEQTQQYAKLYKDNKGFPKF